MPPPVPPGRGPGASSRIRLKVAGAAAARRTLAATAVLLALGACSAARRDRDESAPVRRVTADVAFEMMRDNVGLAVVDLREPEEFAGEPGQIRGARNLPLADLGRHLDELAGLRELVPVRDATFLVYCRERDACGEEGARRLRRAGYRNVLLLEGGIEAWVGSGYGVLGPAPAAAGDPTLGHLAPTHWRRLADGHLFEGGRETASGLFVPGRLSSGRFVPAGGVEGTGEFCSAWRRRSPAGQRTGWLELRDGLFHSDTSPRDPEGPFVRGCLGADGAFRPEAREVR